MNEGIAEKLVREQALEQDLKKTTEVLYGLRCFEMMRLDDGTPVALRVPGGWIFYTRSGGGGMRLITGEDEEAQTIMGQMASTLTGVFVPFNNEFMPRRVTS